MPGRSSKPRDLNSLAASIVDEATDEESAIGFSPAAQRGRQGGEARAAALSPERRRAIARKAAAARWKKAGKR